VLTTEGLIISRTSYIPAVDWCKQFIRMFNVKKERERKV
jgi:hypothetical protein